MRRRGAESSKDNKIGEGRSAGKWARSGSWITYTAETRRWNVERCKDGTHLRVKGVVVEGSVEKGEDRPHRETEQKLHGREKGK